MRENGRRAAWESKEPPKEEQEEMGGPGNITFGEIKGNRSFQACEQQEGD